MIHKTMRELLDELKRLERATTPGKWAVVDDSEKFNDEITFTYDASIVVGDRPICQADYDTAIINENYKNDLPFIAALRNASPVLIEALEKCIDQIVTGYHDCIERGAQDCPSCKCLDKLDALAREVGK